MNQSLMNTISLQTESWSYKRLVILVFALPFLLLMFKFGYREVFHAALALLFFVFSIELPIMSIGMFLLLLVLDLNPSSHYVNEESFFTLKFGGDNLFPVSVLFALAILMGWVFSVAAQKTRKLQFSPMHRPLLAFILWLALVLTINLLRSHYYKGWVTLIAFGLFFVYYDSLKTKEQVRKVFTVLVAALALVLIYSYFCLFTNQFSQAGLKIYILGTEPAQILNLLGIFALTLGLEKNLRFPLAAGILLYIACLVQIFFSTSRANLTGSIFCLFFILFLRFRKNRIVLLTSFALLIIALAILITSFSQLGVGGAAVEQGVKRLSSISTETGDLALIFRMLSYPASLKASLKHPIFGGGFDQGFFIEILEKKFYTTTLDNTHLKLALAAGFPAALLYILCLVVLYKVGISILNRIEPGYYRCMTLSLIAIAALATFVDLFQYNPAFYRATAVVTFAWAGIMRMNYEYKLNPKLP